MRKNGLGRFFSVLLSLAIVLGMVPAYSASAADEYTVDIVNPGFEMDLVNGNIPGWSKDPTATVGLIETSTTVVKSGSSTLHLHDSTNATSARLRVLSDKITVVPGAQYTVTASVYAVQLTASLVHEVQYFTANDVEITPRQQVLNKTSTGITLNTWRTITNVSTAPANAAYAKIGFYSGDPSLTNVYIDDVSMISSTPPPPPLPVQNLGFEMDLSNGKIPGWSLVDTTAGLLELSTDKVRSGAKSLHFKDSSIDTRLQVRSDAISVTAGTYNAKAFVNVVSQSHSIGLEVHYYNAQGAETGTATLINFAASALGTNQWTEMVVPFVVPAGITHVKIIFNSGIPSLTEAYFDDVSVSLNNPPPTDIADAIKNPGFEADLVNGSIPEWTMDPATLGLLELSTERANSGSKSLHFKDSDNVNWTRIFSNKVAVTGGASYIAKASVNVVSQTHNVVLEIYYYDIQGVLLNSKVELFGTLALGQNKWTDMRLLSEAPAAAAYAQIAFSSGGISLTEAYFDDASLTVVPTEVPLARNYAAPVDLGPMVSVSLGQAGVIQENSLGENEVYYHSNGLPGIFTVLDAETGKKKFSQAIPNTESLWAMVVGSDKNVYFAGTNDGVLYRYLPDQKKVESLGTNPSDQWVWDLEATPDGKIYGATFEDKGSGKVFEYDIATNTFRDYGLILQNQDYVRGIAVDDEYIYAALGSEIHLFKIHRVTGEKTEIPVQGYTGTTGIAADVYVVNNKLLFSVSTINLLVLNKDTYEIENSFQYNNMISVPNPANPNLIYYKYGTELFQYDFSANASTKLNIPSPLPDTNRVKDMQWIEMHSGAKAGKTVLAMVTQYGEYILYDPIDNWMSFVELEISAQPVRIQSLETGPDGRLYLGGYQRGMSIYNPFTNKTDLNISSFPQPEGIGHLNDNMYYGTYVGAIMYRYDPKQPASPNNNPEMVFDITHQDRPFAITSGDNKLFVGTVPDYGFLGGALAIYDEATDTWTQFDQVVQDHSIIALAYKDGLLYGGTSVWGGLGSEPSATEAKMFVWDVANGVKVDEFALQIPGIDATPKMIGELSFGPDGNLWGVVDGTIFAMNVATKQIVKSKVIRPSLYNTSKWKAYRLKWGPDGMLYSSLSRKLIAIDPQTLSYKILSNTMINDMTIGIDGSIYYAPEAGIALSRIAVPETDATLSSITINGVPLDGFSPGVLEYSSIVPTGAVVAASSTQAGATVTTAVYEQEKQTRVYVTATDGKSKLVYKINWKIDTSLTGPASVPAGGEVALTYGISNVTSNVYAKSVTVNFDPELLEFVSVDSLVDGFQVVGKSVKPGQVRVLEAATNGPVTGTMDLLTLNFRALVPGQTVTTNVYLSNVIVADDLGQETALGAGAPYQVTITIQKAALNAKIAEAQAVLAKGKLQEHESHWGHYNAYSLQALDDAIKAASAVSASGQASQAALDQAAADLGQAIQTFLGSANQTVSIGDLGVMAANYGATTASANWVSIEMYDMDVKNGTIGIWDLSEMARMILE